MVPNGLGGHSVAESAARSCSHGELGACSGNGGRGLTCWVCVGGRRNNGKADRERSTLASEPRGRRAARGLEHATGHFTWQRISPKRLEIRQHIEDLCV